MSINSRIAELRKKNNISQESLAEKLLVSRQAVQKWESGATMPELNNIIELSKCFNVPLDYLVRGNDTRTTEQLRLERTVIPQYDKMHSWELYCSNLSTEYMQTTDEGKNVECLKQLMEATEKMPMSEAKVKISNIIFDLIINLPQREEYTYIEPSTLERIRSLRDEKSGKFQVLADISSLKSKIHGAWMGRICGCLLGKPVEGIRREEFRKLLTDTDNYPMSRYLKSTEINEEVKKHSAFPFHIDCFADKILCAPTDDDTNYTVLAATKIIENCGLDFKPIDVSNAWAESQTKNAYCTAERVAYCNYSNGYLPPDSAVYKNPFREWIGAQIRGDYFGYINPGDPEKAAEMAWRDASISHVKNGIYGEMFVSAMLACAAVCDDIKTVILGGLSQIPKTSRLYENINNVIKEYENGISYDDFITTVHKRFNEGAPHGWCHTISNAEIVAAALLFGEKDYTKSIGYAVQAGFDTDCNGATVGSVVGMIIGIDGIDKKWKKPINGQLDTTIFGIGKVKIEDMVDLTLKHIKQKDIK